MSPRIPLCVIVLAACAKAPAAPPDLVASPDPRPDIVFVLADDLDVAEMADLPRIQALVGDAGATFLNDFVSLSLCCPSRCTTLTGKYAHNTGVFSNGGSKGGFERFHAQGEEHTIATELAAAGYRTGMFGKYLNGYPNRKEANWVPPGWSEWFGVGGVHGYAEYDYDVNHNGAREHFGRAEGDYLVDVLRDRVAEFLGAAGGHPAFAWVAPQVPHTPAVAAPRYKGRFAGRTAPRTPNFDEADISDKADPLAARQRLSPKAIGAIDDLYRRRLASSLALEDLVQRVVDVQTARGRMANTWLVFASDNGFHLGHHRMARGKETEFEEDLRVPMLVRGPGVAAGSRVESLTVNTDLASTFAEMAGLPGMPGADGRSWLGLVTGHAPGTWRDAFLIERAGQPPEEPESEGRHPARQPAFAGIRTTTLKYVEFESGQSELFDLEADPYELENVAGTRAADVAALSARLSVLRACAEEGCRDAENPQQAGAVQ